MKEKELLGAIVQAARDAGWLVAHFHSVPVSYYPGGRTTWRTPVGADGKGFPDLILVRDRVLVVEVKGGSHKPTPEQQTWLDAFRLAGARAFVWTPKDWPDVVREELKLRETPEPPEPKVKLPPATELRGV